MNITSWMRKELSGLVITTLELVDYTQRAGHTVTVRQPSDGMPLYGSNNTLPDLHTIHSQVNPSTYFDAKPKIMFCHGEPLSSVGNGISMKAIIDLAPLCDAFIAMRQDEWIVWNSIKRTYIVPKGVDLQQYKPIPNVEKLSGEPSVLYYESWRSARNPLYPILAMQEVWKKYPKARLHLWNVTDKRMLDTFMALIKHCKFETFVRSIQGSTNDVPTLINRADIVISGLYPLYARTAVEALACGKGFLGAGYREHDYPFQCELQPESMAKAIINLWENYDKINFREWAEKYHDVKDTVDECLDIYRRYI